MPGFLVTLVAPPSVTQVLVVLRDFVEDNWTSSFKGGREHLVVDKVAPSRVHVDDYDGEDRWFDRGVNDAGTVLTQWRKPKTPFKI